MTSIINKSKRGYVTNTLLFIFVGLAAFLLVCQIRPDNIPFFYFSLWSIIAILIVQFSLSSIHLKKTNHSAPIINSLFICSFTGLILTNTANVVVTLDRSISVFLLSSQIPAKQFSVEKLKSDFIDGYVVSLKAIERRIDEQVITGNFRRVDTNTLELTTKAHDFIKISRVLVDIFKVDKTFVNADQLVLQKQPMP